MVKYLVSSESFRKINFYQIRKLVVNKLNFSSILSIEIKKINKLINLLFLKDDIREQDPGE